MRKHPFVQWLVIVLWLPTLSLAEPLMVPGANGAPLAEMAEFPTGPGRHPALVLAPGSGYHMALPALEETARALVANGVAVFRFNWGYFTAQPKGQASDDLGRELKDLQAVLAAARADSRVLADRVAVGGNHSFEDRRLPPEAVAADRARNLAAVAAVAATFISETVHSPTQP